MHQLSIREFLGKANKKKRLIIEPRELFQDSYMYVEKMLLMIRNSPDIFNLVVAVIPPSIPNLDLLVESFAFSFFEDLMNPDNS